MYLSKSLIRLVTDLSIYKTFIVFNSCKAYNKIIHLIYLHFKMTPLFYFWTWLCVPIYSSWFRFRESRYSGLTVTCTSPMLNSSGTDCTRGRGSIPKNWKPKNRRPCTKHCYKGSERSSSPRLRKRPHSKRKR